MPAVDVNDKSTSPRVFAYDARSQTMHSIERLPLGSDAVVLKSMLANTLDNHGERFLHDTRVLAETDAITAEVANFFLQRFAAAYEAAVSRLASWDGTGSFEVILPYHDIDGTVGADGAVTVDTKTTRAYVFGMWYVARSEGTEDGLWVLPPGGEA